MLDSPVGVTADEDDLTRALKDSGIGSPPLGLASAVFRSLIGRAA